MKIKVIILLCCLFISGCASTFGKQTHTYVVANNNRGYLTNCNTFFEVFLLFYVMPFLLADSDLCNTIYIKEDKFSILHNGKLYEPIRKFDKFKRKELYIIRIDVNKLKKDKEAKVVYENNKTEALKLYEEYIWGYGTVPKEKRALTPTRKYFPSE